MLTPREQLANAIRAARGAKHWTQQDLATRMGVARQTVAAYEEARNWPQPRQAHLLKELLGIDVPEEPHERPIRTPANLSAADAKGVRYAALAMSRTLTRLLEEAADAEQSAEEQAIRERAIRAAAAPPATPNGGTVRPKKRARG